MSAKIEKAPQHASADPRLVAAWTDHGRQFEAYRWVYPVVSRRSGGISLGINLNLDTHCNFDCVYCQVDRTQPVQGPTHNDVAEIERELRDAIAHWRYNRFQDAPRFQGLDSGQLELRDISLSGDGEPTMVTEFSPVCAMLHRLQTELNIPHLKLVVITNATLLDQPRVREGLAHLTALRGEIWGKLDAGSEAWYHRVDRGRVSLDRIEANLSLTAARFPLRIQTMLCRVQDEIPSTEELRAYAQRLRHIEDSARAAGRSLLEIQLYTVVRRTAEQHVAALPMSFLEDVRDALKHWGITTPISLY